MRIASSAGGSATWTVDVGADCITAALDAPAATGSATVFVCAHGAGGHLADRGMLALASLFRTRGLAVVRFNFPYSERKSRRPDRMPLLRQCIAAVVARAREELPAKRWIIGGRSMGGRAASMLAADGFACDGLLLLAYPLHPAGMPEKLRAMHLSSIAVPVLCLNGTRDALCRRDLMDDVVGRLGPNWRMHWLDGADHSFHVPRSAGRSDADILQEIGDATVAWLESITTTAAARHSPRRR